MGAHLTLEQKQVARRLRAKGLTFNAIARDLNCVHRTIVVTVREPQVRPAKGAEWEPAPGRLGLEERCDIMVGLAKEESMSEIARQLGRSPSTVCREVAANGGPTRYGAWTAHCRARGEARRPKTAKLSHRALAEQVSTWLEEWWSPKEISARLRIEFADDPMMQVSHETIYQSLFVQGRGELRRELARCLRSGRAKRRPQGRLGTPGRIPGKVMISERPAEADDRAVPGHWEGDLIMGANNRTAVGTLVERSTRYVLLLHLGQDHGAEAVDQAMRRAIATLPGELFRTITWELL